jgi:hypothetical protein
LAEAVRYHKLADALHDSFGMMTKLGFAYEFGRGELKDQALALSWYQAAANADNPEAHGHLGFCLRYGLGCQPELSQSLQSYKLSADQGDFEGSLGLATARHFGVGCDEDLDEAADSYERTYQKPRGRWCTDSYRCDRALGRAGVCKPRLPARSDTKPAPVDRHPERPPAPASSNPSDYLAPFPATRSGLIIGCGQFSTVTCEHDAETGERIAVKRFNTETFEKDTFIREVETLARLNHPCVLRIRAWRPPIGNDPGEIRTDLAENGSLGGILEKVGHGTSFPFWNPTGKGILICGIALGMKFVHSKGIIHGDLKPSNILVSARGEALMSDFGVSRVELNDYTLSLDAGTVNYAAPERFIEDAIHTRQVDVWAFGLVMYEILTGTAVFPSSSDIFPIVRRISSGEMPAVPEECGSLMQELIVKCWTMDPAGRPTIEKIVADFKAAKFRIVPGADPEKLRRYVEAIERNEAHEATQSK